jgi:hypothetical protein
VPRIARRRFKKGMNMGRNWKAQLAAIALATSFTVLVQAGGGFGGGAGGFGGGGMGGMGGMGGGGMGGMGGGGMGGMGGGGMGGGGMGGGGMGGGGFGGQGGGVGGGGYTRMSTTDMIRQQMSISNDNEWAVILPKLQRVIDAQAALNGTRGGRGMGGMGGMGGGRDVYGGAMGMGGFMDPTAGTQPATAPADPVQVAQTELNAVLQSQTSTVEAVAAKLKALREARAKAKDTLKQAQDDLKSILSIRQEATLVNLGYLE